MAKRKTASKRFHCFALWRPASTPNDRGITIRCTRSCGPHGFFCLQVFRRGPVIADVITLEQMEHSPAFRITKDDIENLRDHTRDQSLIDAFSRWLNRGDQLDSLIHQIENAFASLSLGDGTGLLEANGLDDYATKDELAKLRSSDEHTDWRRIDVDTLNRCHAALTFMNARGFIFHLPAFLIAELNDSFDYGIIDHLFEPNRLPNDWIPLLDNAQRNAIIALLSAIIEHPNYCDHAKDIEMAISRIGERA